MNTPQRQPIGALARLGTPYAGAPALMRSALADFNAKIIVLDDDPTGVQTVHDVYVYTDWEEETIRRGFLDENRMFFILTNSRSFSARHTAAVHADIARRICTVAKALRRDFVLISRGDSTLRGHWPLETDTLRAGVEGEMGYCLDGEVICPFFREGGRFTFGNVHYVQEGAALVPAGETEFAGDKTFGYTSSDLTQFVEEKTGGACAAADCIAISLAALRAGDVEGVTEKLLAAHDYARIIVNAVDYRDLEVFCAAFLRALGAGKHFLARTAAAFPKVLAGVSDRPLLTQAELTDGATCGGMVLVGSHVKKTTAQLDALRQSKSGKLEFIEFDVSTGLVPDGLAAEVARVVALAEAAIRAGTTAVVFTSRRLMTPDTADKDEILALSTRISDAVTSVVGRLSVRPRFLVAKGGITSSDVGVKALGVKRARVLGQIRKGVPVWLTGAESKFPGMPYIIFPGNVGEVSTLREIVEELMN